MEFLDRGDGIRIAFLRDPGNQPTLVFLPGFGSDMMGDKATDLAAHAHRRGLGSLRLDYSGHGASAGAFEAGTIGGWCRDALAVIDRTTEGRLIIAGSSMGGWIALLAALARPERVAGLLLIAPAPDFTDWGLWDNFTAAQREALERAGEVRIPMPWNEELRITRALIEDGRQHRLLGGKIPVACPVRILHGQADEQVPWEIALRVAERILGPDVRVTLVKDGGHRLSRPDDLAELRAALDGLLPSSPDT